MSKQSFIEMRAAAFNTMKEVRDQNQGVTIADLPEDGRAKYEKSLADFNKANEEIRNLEAFQKAQAQMSEGTQERQYQAPANQTLLQERKAAFMNYLKNPRALTERQREIMHMITRGTDAQKTTPDSAGGFLIDDELAGEINVQQLFVSEMEAACRVVTTNRGNDIKFPKVNDTGTNGTLSTEAARDSAAIAVADMTFEATTLGAYFYPSNWVKMTLELEEDIEFSLDSFLLPVLAERINRAKNVHLTTGDGSGKPQGLVTASAAGVTAASTTAFTHEELVELFYSVDRSYRDNQMSAWMMSDAVEKAVVNLGLTPAENFNPIRFDASGAMSIMGKPVYSNKDMATTIEASAKTMLFGDFGQYVIRKVQGTRIVDSRDAYIASGQLGYMAYERVDGKLIGPSSAIKHLIQAAA